MTATTETAEALGAGWFVGRAVPISTYAAWMVASRAVQMQHDQLLLLFEEPQVVLAEGVTESHARASIEADGEAYADAASFLLRYMLPYASTRRKSVAKLQRMTIAEMAQLPKQEVRHVLMLEEAGRQVLTQEEYIASRVQNSDPWAVSGDALQVIDAALALQVVHGSEDLMSEAVDVRASGFLHLAVLTLE